MAGAHGGQTGAVRFPSAAIGARDGIALHQMHARNVARVAGRRSRPADGATAFRDPDADRLAPAAGRCLAP